MPESTTHPRPPGPLSPQEPMKSEMSLSSFAALGLSLATMVSAAAAAAPRVELERFVGVDKVDRLPLLSAQAPGASRSHARSRSDRNPHPARGGTATAGGGAPATITERECNDSQGWADPFHPITALPASETATGICATLTDYDWFSLTLPASLGAAFKLDLSVTAGDLVFFNSAGSKIDDSASIGSLSLPVPAGTYGIRVAHANGSYSLTYAASAYVMPVIGNTPTNLALGTSESKMFRVDVTGGPRRVTIKTANGFPGVSAFGLEFAAWNGGKLFTTFDSSFGLGFPAYDGILPVGSYRVYLFESIGIASTVDVSVTQSAITAVPSAPIGGSVSGTYLGEETKLIYQLIVTTPSRVTFRTSGGVSPAASDTRLYLLDANFDFLAFNEDEPFSFYAALGLMLPAGTYYLVSEPFPSDTGNVVITGSALTATPATILRAGSNTGLAVPAKGSSLFTYDPRTPVPCDYTVNGAGTFDPVTVLMDANGLLLGWDDNSGARFLSSFVGNTAGVSYVMVTDSLYAVGSVDVVVHPKLYTEANGANRRLVFVDKVTHGVALFLSTSTNPGFSLPPILGNICIGPAGLVAGPVLTVPAGQGVFSLTGYPNVTGVLFTQNVSLDPVLGTFRMTNIID